MVTDDMRIAGAECLASAIGHKRDLRELAAEIYESMHSIRPRFDKRLYMREYMRDYRARKSITHGSSHVLEIA